MDSLTVQNTPQWCTPLVAGDKISVAFKCEVVYIDLNAESDSSHHAFHRSTQRHMVMARSKAVMKE